MNLWDSLDGSVTVSVTTADIPGLLNALEEKVVRLQEMEALDLLTMRLTLGRKDLRTLRKLCGSRGDSLRLLGRTGIFWKLLGVGRRPVLLFGMGLLLFLTLFLPTRVLFIEVEGNGLLPDRMILENAAKCGITFGSSRKAVRSERMKNALLEAMPELQWAGINTKGCVATITVRERNVVDFDERSVGVSSIVAGRDGIITECTVTRGTSVCRPGQAVKAGQLLISGYTNCNLVIQAGRAEGEVFALTRRDLSVITPTECGIRGDTGEETKKYALIIGKKRINFYKGSGILDTGCVRMYSEKYMTLPGGFVLPLVWVTEAWQDAPMSQVERELDEEMLSILSRAYLTSRMQAGRILSCTENWNTDNGIRSLTGTYVCLEMIGVRKQEEIVKPNE